MSTQTVMKTLEGLIEQSKGFDAHKHDYWVNPREIIFRDDGNFYGPDANFATSMGQTGMFSPLAMTPHAERQLYGRLGVALMAGQKPLHYDTFHAMRKNYGDLYARTMNAFLQNKRVNDLLVRGYSDTCRAILSSRYATVSNTEVLEKLSAVIGEKSQGIEDLEIRRNYLSADELNLYVIWKNVPDPEGQKRYGIGAQIGNGEIGNSALVVRPCIWRSACNNSIIFDGNGIYMRHIGNTNALLANLAVNIANVIPQAAHNLERVYLAEMQQLSNMDKVLEQLGKQYKWSEKVERNVAIGTESDHSVMGVINGITYAAHKSGLTLEETTSMELEAGKLLLNWNHLVSIARR